MKLLTERPLLAAFIIFSTSTVLFNKKFWKEVNFK